MTIEKTTTITYNLRIDVPCPHCGQMTYVENGKFARHLFAPPGDVHCVGSDQPYVEPPPPPPPTLEELVQGLQITIQLQAGRISQLVADKEDGLKAYREERSRASGLTLDIQVLRQECDTLKATLQDRENHINALDARYLSLETQYNSTRQAQGRAEAEAIRLHREKEAAENKLLHFHRNNQDADDALLGLRANLQEAREGLKEANDEAGRLERKLHGIKTVVEASQQALHRHNVARPSIKAKGGLDAKPPPGVPSEEEPRS